MDEFLKSCHIKNKIMEHELKSFLVYEKPKSRYGNKK